MSFNDIDKMFTAAVDASEDTGEGDVGSEKTVKAEPKAASKAKVEPKVEVKQDKVEKESKPKVTQKQEKKSEPKIEPKKEPKRKPLVAGGTNSAVAGSITENSITKILKMNSTFNELDDTEKEFVSGYFQVDFNKDDTIAKVVYGALTANQRDLDALSKIVVARNETAAERAFYLMSLDNNSIEAIYEQLDLLAGNLDKISGVNSENKINVCRVIEKTISEMPDNVFVYISKLQELTSLALDK